MGANAQTTVPDFVAETVLTAAKLDISAATGVPVFATTVTRDAAFGGANKVLAEGQTCYLESTNVVQYYDGAAWATVGPSVSSPITAIGIDQVLTAQTTTSASYVALTTASAVTITTGTSAIVMLSCTFHNSGNTNQNRMAFAITGATTVSASDDYATLFFNDLADFDKQSAVSIYLVTGLTAGSNTFSTQFKTQGGTMTAYNRTITVLAI